MARFHTALALLALLGCAAADTTGASLNFGYIFGSDVQGYLDMSQDVCDIAAAADARDWASATAVYESGKSSKRTDGTLRTLKDWATTPEDTETHWGMYSRYFGNDSDWMDAFVTSGLEGQEPYTVDGARAQVVKKGTQSNILTAYVFHEVDEGAEKTAAGETDPAEGAPHNVDEAAGIYFGTTCPAGGLADVATKRATAWGTLVAQEDGTCVAPTNLAAAKAFSDMQSAASLGDAAAYATAVEELEKAVVTVFTQATLTYAGELDELVAGGGAADNVAEAAAEGVAFFRTIAPMVAEVSADDAATIADLLENPALGMKDQATTAFQATLEAYGITPEELGSFGANSTCAGAGAAAALTESMG